LITEFSIFGPFKVLITYIVEPSLYVSVLISMTGLLLFNLSKWHLALSITNIALFSVVTIGRAPIFFAAVCLILSFAYALSTKKIRFRFVYIPVLVLPVIFIAFLSMYRKNIFDIRAIVLLRNYFVWYLTGPFTALELFLDNYQVTYDWDYSYIRGLFAGIEEIFKPVTKKLADEYIPINDSFHEITKVFRSLGGKAIGHNSHYTMLYEFIRDAGIFGVIFFSYFLGIVNSILYNYFRKRMDIFSFSLMIIVLYLSLMGITRWELRYPWAWLTIIGLFFTARKFVMKKQREMPDAVN